MFKRVAFTLFCWDITIKFTALKKWNDFKVFKSEHSRHLVWGKLSILLEDWTLEIHPTCSQCGSASIGEVSYGDEGLTVCESCQSVEQGYEYVNLRAYDKAECI